jgi:hypothetical protein
MRVQNHTLIILLMCASALTQTKTAAAGSSAPANRRPAIAVRGYSVFRDTALDHTGMLAGRVTTAAVGVLPLPIKVVLRRDQLQVAQVETDREGNFCFRQVSSGIYELEVCSSDGRQVQTLVRVWNHGTAPPSAEKSLWIALEEQTVIRGQYENPLQALPVRGQNASSGIRRIFRNPWITAAIITTAIAVPIALTHEGDEAS